MSEGARAKHFGEIALPHLDAAYNLARWLMRNEVDAEDMVQDAYLRAFRYFDGFAGTNARAWLLSIVRRVCYDALRRRSRDGISFEDAASPAFDDAIDGFVSRPVDPETSLLREADRALLDRLIAALPPLYREVIVLRELEELSYREIADVVGIPLGTVMSRLNRARALLLKAWQTNVAREAARGL